MKCLCRYFCTKSLSSVSVQGSIALCLVRRNAASCLCILFGRGFARTIQAILERADKKDEFECLLLQTFKTPSLNSSYSAASESSSAAVRNMLGLLEAFPPSDSSPISDESTNGFSGRRVNDLLLSNPAMDFIIVLAIKAFTT